MSDSASPAGVSPARTNPADDYWTVFPHYESGKSRRYGHLFAVNGGAFAIVGFLAPRYSGEDVLSVLFGLWAFIVVPVLLGVFAWYMCEDIDSFGRGMRKRAGFAEEPVQALGQGIYSKDGRRLLRLVQLIFTSAWLVAALIGVAAAVVGIRDMMA